MLIEFSVGNYRSFKERVTLSMEAAAIASRPSSLDEHNVFKARDDLRLLTSAAIYGANASGKSNLIRALLFLHDFVQNSTQQRHITTGIHVEAFSLHTETEHQPSYFEIVFIIEGIQYRYGLEVTREAVHREWLYELRKQREVLLFERNAQNIRVSARNFREGRGLEQRVRKDSLLLTVSAQFNGPIAGVIMGWFEKNGVYFGVGDAYDLMKAAENFADSDYREAISAFIQRLDTGIDGVRFERNSVAPSNRQSEDEQAFWHALHAFSNALESVVPDFRIKDEVITVRTLHKKYGPENGIIGETLFEIEGQESAGTQRLFTLSFAILDVLRAGGILVVDELDARIHPNLVIELIRLFNNPVTNSHHAQLIFTTHNTNLLSAKLFRRDQVWFMEKSRRGVSDLYSLVEYRVDNKIVRSDASFEQDYILGRYGAVPFIGDLGALLGAEHEQTAQS